MKKRHDITIAFGAFAAPLSQQVCLRPGTAKALQRSADAITWLLIQGLLSDAEAHRARLRLVRAIEKRLEEPPT